MPTHLFSSMSLTPPFIYDNVTLVAGAGCSYDLGYPLVNEFLSPQYLTWLSDQCAATPAGRRSDLLPYLLKEAECFKAISANIETVLALAMENRDMHARVVSFIYEVLSAAADNASASRETGTTAEHLVLASILIELCCIGAGTVVTFNYDTAIEEAVSYISLQEGFPATAAYFNYGHPEGSMVNVLDDSVSNYTGTKLPATYPSGRVPILKLHGSLNVLVCETCGSLHYAPSETIGEHLGNNWQGMFGRRRKCRVCSNDTLAFHIVPPGMRKVLPPILAPIWESAERALAKSKLVMIIGYSVPAYDADARALLEATLIEKDVLLVDPFPQVDTISFLQRAGAKLTIVPATMADFLAREATEYAPDIMTGLAQACVPRVLYPERLVGHRRAG